MYRLPVEFVYTRSIVKETYNLMSAPLAERMRPKSLAEYVGQEHLVGKEGSFRQMLAAATLPSLILWGPPGVGKTTLAQILAQESKRPFHALSAINSGVKELREVIHSAQNQGAIFQQSPVVFVDEIHRFSKSQQDALLGAVEKGTITLIGATTENPSFEVINALLSRCQVYTLKPLEEKQLLEVLKSALETDPILQRRSIELAETQALIHLSGGDARKLLSLLELMVLSSPESKPLRITDAGVKEMTANQPLMFDKKGDFHYDIISAFIKSIRGSDPNGTVYWLARMIEAGEDPKFIARRMIISAAEDIGNANPTALVLATNTFQAVQAVGFPEARIVLSQCALYLATSAKSNAAYLAIKNAQKMVHETQNLNVPLHLCNAPTALMKKEGKSLGYHYPHDYPNSFVPQQYLPDDLSDEIFYRPGNNPREADHLKMLKERWKDRYDY